MVCFICANPNIFDGQHLAIGGTEQPVCRKCLLELHMGRTCLINAIDGRAVFVEVTDESTTQGQVLVLSAEDWQATVGNEWESTPTREERER